MNTFKSPPNLKEFLDARRVPKGSSDWNMTGMAKYDMGRYHVSDDEYDTFLTLFHGHVFGKKPMLSSLLERHLDVGPPLVDLDLQYEKGGPLQRRFTSDTIKKFVAEYVSAMVYFSKVEALEKDLVFYHLEKPAPEDDKAKGIHKDGVHIQCPTITTTPKYQYGIRGFLLSKNIVGRVIGGTTDTHVLEDVYDEAVIHRNNWFFYGASKPDKTQYSVKKIWRVAISDIRDSLDGGDPLDFTELSDIIASIMTEETVSTNSLELVKTLSIRKNHTTATPLEFRSVRTQEWEELMIQWGSGNKKLDRVPAVKNTIEFVDEEDTMIVSTSESRRATSEMEKKDVDFAYRLARECLNAERRVGDYQDWVNLAICLKNISNTEDSFRVWMEVTRRANPAHKKTHMSEAELKSKWILIRVDSSKRLSLPSLYHWAREDNPDKHKSILSAHISQFILMSAKDTHVNIASVVCEMYKNEFRCSMGAKRGLYLWYQYVPGSHAWKQLRTPTELRARLSCEVRREYVNARTKLFDDMKETTDSSDKERIEMKQKVLSKVDHDLEMANFKDNVLKECQEKFYDDEFIDRMNTNPYLVGVMNGVLNLRHYANEEMVGSPRVQFRDGRPDDNICFQMGRCDPDLDPICYVPYNPDSPEQKALLEFFTKIYPDAVLREYVLTLLASCLEGANKEQKFYVMQGPGSNGKSMIEILMEVTFGDYGTSMSTTTLTRKRPDAGAANPDIITVKCKRYIHTGEPDDNEKINTAIMKQYSGGDRVPARGLFSEQEKFVITGKIFMSCNDLPPVSKMDGGTWRRIRVIPHVSIFKDAGDPLIDPSKNIYEKDLDMENKLKHWRTAFLGLLVHYYDTKYLVHGLREPSCVSAASDKYKEENDVFMTFFTENFVKEPGAGPIYAKEVKNMFNDWRKALGRACDLKHHQVLERMKTTCASGSTDKEFWGIRVAEETDLSGATIHHI